MTKRKKRLITGRTPRQESYHWQRQRGCALAILMFVAGAQIAGLLRRMAAPPQTVR